MFRILVSHLCFFFTCLLYLTSVGAQLFILLAISRKRHKGLDISRGSWGMELRAVTLNSWLTMYNFILEA